jgi:sterol desaturase/sphingolipid hydroxylase (fatty acid hydroxylase superfamily)
LGINTVLIFVVFAFLVLLRLINHHDRKLTMSRNKNEWVVDLFGLFIQGVIIPLLPIVIVPFLEHFFPSLNKSINMSPVYQFLTSFVLVDYLYYWNHRFFHTKKFWHIHRLHHSSKQLDVFATSRNSFLTSFVFVYLWSQIIGLYLLEDPTYFLAGFGLTFALDLWRHGGVSTPNIVRKILSPIIILPEHHVFHHSLSGRTKNYGANLSCWDKIHRTFSNEIIPNQNLEKLPSTKIWSELLYPRRTGK